MSHRNRISRKKKLFSRMLRSNPTTSEELLWKALRQKKLGVKVRRQAILYGYIVDFWIPSEKMVIEIDGGYHETVEQYKSDFMRTQNLKKHGIKVVRYFNNQVLNHIDRVIEDLKKRFYESSEKSKNP